MSATTASARPLVSVLVPAYNAAAFLGETIDSLLAQSYPNVEIIVVDDGSKDDTPKVIARYGDRVRSKRQPNGGLAAARNAAFELARGYYVAWLDADDVAEPERIALQVGVLEKDRQCVVVASDFSAFDASGWTEASHAASYYSSIGRRGLPGIFLTKSMLSTADLPVPASVPESVAVYSGHIRETLIFGNCLHPPTIMARRDAAAEAGPAEARFGNDVDYEYFLRLTRLGPAAFIDRPLIRYRYSTGQMSSDKNLGKLATSLVTVLEHVAEAEPHRREDPAFRRRMAEVYLRAAHATADDTRLRAAGHLVRSLRTGGVLDAATTLRTALKLAIPRSALRAYRSRRRSAA
jgi:glycosyltransferase involved in cell wall biosynthesis